MTEDDTTQTSSEDLPGGEDPALPGEGPSAALSSDSRAEVHGPAVTPRSDQSLVDDAAADGTEARGEAEVQVAAATGPGAVDTEPAPAEIEPPTAPAPDEIEPPTAPAPDEIEAPTEHVAADTALSPTPPTAHDLAPADFPDYGQSLRPVEVQPPVLGERPAQAGESLEVPAVPPGPDVPDIPGRPDVDPTPDSFPASPGPDFPSPPPRPDVPRTPEPSGPVVPELTPEVGAEPMIPASPADPSEHADPSEPTDLSQPGTPSELADPAEPADPASPAAAGPETVGSDPEQQPVPPTSAPTSPTAGPERRPGAGAGLPGAPGSRRTGRPGASPGNAKPARSRPAGGHAPPTPESTSEPTDPHKWGRIDPDGVVYVYSSTGERAVGNWQAGEPEEGLAHYARRFDDFATEIALLETRLATGSGDPKTTRAHAIELRESVDTLAGVGDLDSAAARLEIVIGAADAAIAGASTARAAARAAAVAAKESLCSEAENLAESEQWKSTGDRLKEIVDEWRTIRGIDRKTDDALWKRFAKARDGFTRRRGTHFADLDKQRTAAKDAKEVLIAAAEILSESSEWGKTAGEYRTLMEQWKASGRAPRDVEDALWERFRAAQEKFFSRRNQTFSQRDSEFEANAAAKEALLAEAEKMTTAGGVDTAKAALRSIQERWEAAGKVPRERIKEFDARLRAVEDRIRSAEDSHWRRTDPETSARIEQFRSRVESYRAQAAKARTAGNERKAREAEQQAAQWQEWLATAQGSVER